MIKLKITYLFLFLCLLSGCSLVSKISGEKRETPAFFPVWIKDQDPSYRSGNLPISLQVPTIDRGIVFVGDDLGKMKALQLSDGRKIWEEQDKGAHQGRPLVLGEHILYGTIEGRFYARHRLSGKLKFAVELGAAVESTPQISQGRLFVHTRNHQIFCLDATTGKILWAYRRSVPFLTTLQGVSTPLIIKNRVYIGFADGSLVALSMEEGVLIWENKVVIGQKFVDADTGPVYFAGQLFMGSLANQLAMVDPGSGILRRRFPYVMTTSPLIHNGQMIFGTERGKVIVLDQNLEEKMSFQVDDKQQAISSLCLWKGGLVAASRGGILRLVSLEKQGKLLGRWELGHAYSSVFGDMVAKDDRLAVYSSRNKLYIFK